MTSKNMYTPPHPTGDYDLSVGAAVCTLIEPIAEKHGYHVALTGGCLYGEGGRKDIDIVFYRIRQVIRPDDDSMFDELEVELEMTLLADHGFVKKFEMGNIPIDALFPESGYGDYPIDSIREKESKDFDPTTI